MFSLVNGIYDNYLAPTQLNLLVVGPPGGGKTALLERLKVTQIPRRPRKPPSLSLEALPPALEHAFQEAGAEPYRPEIRSPIAKTADRKRVSAASPSPSSVVVTQARRRGLALICPAPERYRRSKDDQDEVFEEEDANSLAESPGPPQLRTRSHSKEFDMEEVSDLVGSSNPPPSPISAPSTPQKVKEPDRPSLLQSNFEEVDRKPQCKMLPLTKIRPTIGTNLGKIEMYGAKINLFDVGGRMRDLWERYYEDCDGVVFCWKLGGADPEAPEPDSDDEEEEPFDMSQQQEILNEVRKAIPDDVPFLVFGHVFGTVNTQITDKVYATNALFPHYHNPITGFCCGSAKTGAGVQSAMEWLIPLSKRQKKERLARKERAEQATKQV